MFWSVRTWFPWTNKVSTCRNALLYVYHYDISKLTQLAGIFTWITILVKIPKMMCQFITTRNCFSVIKKLLHTILLSIVRWKQNFPQKITKKKIEKLTQWRTSNEKLFEMKKDTKPFPSHVIIDRLRFGHIVSLWKMKHQQYRHYEIFVKHIFTGYSGLTAR